MTTPSPDRRTASRARPDRQQFGRAAGHGRPGGRVPTEPRLNRRVVVPLRLPPPNGSGRHSVPDSRRSRALGSAPTGCRHQRVVWRLRFRRCGDRFGPTRLDRGSSPGGRRQRVGRARHRRRLARAAAFGDKAWPALAALRRRVRTLLDVLAPDVVIVDRNLSRAMERAMAGPVAVLVHTAFGLYLPVWQPVIDAANAVRIADGLAPFRPWAGAVRTRPAARRVGEPVRPGPVANTG
jgi:hypothetical protein